MLSTTAIIGSKIYASRPDWRVRHPTGVGIDMLPGDGVDLVMDLEEELLPANHFELVECISVLEHSKKPWAMAANIEQGLKTGGKLILSVPFIWKVHGYPSDYFRFTDAGVRLLFPSIEWEHLHYVGYDGIGRPNAQRLKVGTEYYGERTQVEGVGVKK